MARKKARLTTRKRPNTQKINTTGDPYGPSLSEYESLQQFQKIVICDEDGKEHVFGVGNIVSILPPISSPNHGGALPLSSMWWAVIREIRQRNADIEDVWARVQWFYSAKDVKDVVKSFKEDEIGAHERIFSDHLDLVHSSTLDEVIQVERYDPFKIDDREIRIDSNWFRYDFEKDARVLIPKPSSTTHTCIPSRCPNPSYVPPDSEKARRTGKEIATLYGEIHAVVKNLLDLSTTNAKGKGKQNQLISPPNKTNNIRIKPTKSKSKSASIPPPTADIPTLLESLRALHARLIELEGTLVMHICPRKECSGRRGRAYHRGCCLGSKLRDRSCDDDGRYRENNGEEQEADELENGNRGGLEMWRNRWRRMGRRERKAVRRVVRLIFSEEEEAREGSGSGKDKGKANANVTPRKRRTRNVRVEEGEDDGDNRLPDEISFSPSPRKRPRQSTSKPTSPTKNSYPPSSLPGRRPYPDLDPSPSLTTFPFPSLPSLPSSPVASSSRNRDYDSGPSTSLEAPDGNDNQAATRIIHPDISPSSPIPDILHVLSLLPPALVCLASQPIVRGGVRVPIEGSGSRMGFNSGDMGEEMKNGLPADFGFDFGLRRGVGRPRGADGDVEMEVDPEEMQLTIGISHAITGNTSFVLRARTRVRDMIKHIHTRHQSGDDLHIDAEMEKDWEGNEKEEKDPWVDWEGDLPTDWELYVIEMEGREWFFDREPRGRDAGGDEDVEMASPGIKGKGRAVEADRARGGPVKRSRTRSPTKTTNSTRTPKTKTKTKKNESPALQRNEDETSNEDNASIITAINNILRRALDISCPSCGGPI